VSSLKAENRFSAHKGESLREEGTYQKRKDAGEYEQVAAKNGPPHGQPLIQDPMRRLAMSKGALCRPLGEYRINRVERGGKEEGNTRSKGATKERESRIKSAQDESGGGALKEA
jgi:hypothetical protein